MKKENKGGRAVFTAGVLLLLVIAAAWTLKVRGETKKTSAEAELETPKEQEAEAGQGQNAEQQTPEAEQPEGQQPETEQQTQEQSGTEQQPGAEQQPEGQTPDTAQGGQTAPDDAAAAEQRASFTADYDSAPLLNTTPVKYLSMEVGATEDEVRFNWMSPSSSPGQVSWYTVQNGDFQMVTAQCSPSATMPGYYVNKASVTGLKPGMTYAYKVGNDAGGWSPEYKYTVPDVNTKEGFTFLVTSDAQIGQDQYQEQEVSIEDWDKVVTRLTSYVPEAQFLVHAGDQVAQFGNPEEYSGFLDHLGLYKIPLVPVVGNHDVANEDVVEELGYSGGPFFYEHFNVPNRSEEYGYSEKDKDGNYYFIRGDVLFIVLNSITSQPTDIHEEYVPKVIEQHPDTKWRVIIQHYPPYSNVEKYQKEMDGWMRNSLGYICEDNDIDLVITGHDASYSRSAFTNRKCEPYKDYDYSSGATVVNPEGTMFVTCSTASGSLYQAVSPNENLVVQAQPEAPMALRFDVTENQFHLRAYAVDSWTVIDEYTIQKD